MHWNNIHVFWTIFFDFLWLAVSTEDRADSLTNTWTGPPGNQDAQPVAIDGFWTVWNETNSQTLLSYRCTLVNSNLRDVCTPNMLRDANIRFAPSQLLVFNISSETECHDAELPPKFAEFIDLLLNLAKVDNIRQICCGYDIWHKLTHLTFHWWIVVEHIVIKSQHVRDNWVWSGANVCKSWRSEET